MRIDHVVYAVSDLEHAEIRFAREYGLEAAGGGEHPAFGTRNRILPVGFGEYIELMAVADERAKHPLARAVSEAVSDGDRPLALCLRPESLDAAAKRLDLDVAPGERRNPDGEVLRWRLAGLEAALGPERLPFFIDWQGVEERLDRQHADAARTDGFAWVECGGDRERLAKWIGGDEVPVRAVDGEPGPRTVGISLGADTVIVR